MSAEWSMLCAVRRGESSESSEGLGGVRGEDDAPDEGDGVGEAGRGGVTLVVGFNKAGKAYQGLARSFTV